MRERAVLNQQFTRSDKFWNEVIHLFQFCWPYGADEAFSLDQKSGLYHFSGLYERQVREIRMWKMHPSFFVSYPDTYDDIEGPDYFPLRILPPDAEEGSVETWAVDCRLHI